MKIAYIVSLYPAVSHTFILNEIAGLRARGFEIGAFSIRKAPPAQILGERAAREAASTRWLVPPDLPHLVLAFFWAFFTRPARFFGALRDALLWPNLGIRRRLLWLCYFGEAVELAHWIVRDGFTHLHCHFGNGGSNTAMLAAHIADVPFSMTLHGIDLDEPEKFRLAEKAARARFLVCISKFGKSRLMSVTRPELWPKIRVVRCAVTPPREITAAPGAGRIVCVARLSPEKGHLVLLEALALLRERAVPFHCTLVGDGPLRDTLEARVRALGLGDSVAFAGALEPAAVAEHYVRADAAVLASFGEGIPMVLMEAMSHGRPVVATYVGGIPELVDHGASGCLAPPGSVRDLADALQRVLADPAAARAMGARGRAIVEARYNEAAAMDRLAALFEGRTPGVV